MATHYYYACIHNPLQCAFALLSIKRQIQPVAPTLKFKVGQVTCFGQWDITKHNAKA